MDFTKNFSLKGKIAFVTGASYGIGFAIATAFAEAGATIVFNDINQDLVNKGLAAYEEKSSELISVCRGIQKLTASVGAMVIGQEMVNGGSDN